MTDLSPMPKTLQMTSSVPKSKIALFLPCLAGGGAERSILNLSGCLGDRGYDVDMIVARSGGEFLPLVPSTVKLVELHAQSTFGSLPALTRYLRCVRPGVIMSALDHANIVAQLACRLSGTATRSIISVRNTFSAESELRPSPKRRIEVALASLLYPRADGILAVSQGVADDLERCLHIPADKITVTYNPVVSDRLFEQAHEPVDPPWFEAGAPPVILAAGRLSDQKDYPTLIRAFQTVQASVDARLLILGDGERREDLEALVTSLGLQDKVRMPGFTDNPFAYMARARLFVLSSRHEGLPGVLIQALACGCPVISTDCPSGPSEILKNGKYGALVPVGAPEALSSAILEELSHPLQPPSSESWSPFTWESSTQRYLDVLCPSAQ